MINSLNYEQILNKLKEKGLSQSEIDIKIKNKWLEVMGAGMVHRKVLEGVNYDPEIWQGFAFGLGLERFAMIKYNIHDVRLLYSGDMRFIHQFN